MAQTLNLLLIEDNPDDATLIERHLRDQGALPACRQVSEADEIAAALDRADWDAVLCDYSLPGVDFFELLAQIRARLPDVPIILVTGCIGEEGAVDLLKAGVSDFVLKRHLVRLLPAIERGLAEAAERRARRALEDAVRESEARANLILDASPEATLVIDARGIIVRSNDRADRIFGYTSGALTGLPYRVLVPQDRRDAHDALHVEYVAAPRRRPMGEGLKPQGQRRDGSLFPAELSLAPVEIAGELQIIVTVVDVSARRQAELERERLARIVEVSGDMLALVDRELRYVVANPAYAALVGRPPGSLRGQQVREVLGPLMFNDVAEHLDAALAGQVRRFRVRRSFADGRRFALDAEYRPFVVDGEVQGVVASLRDVTARVFAEEALDRAQSMAQLGSWTYDVASDRFQISEETRRVFGLPRNHARAAELRPFVHRDDAERVVAQWRRTLATGEPYDIEHRVFVLGRARHIHAFGEATRDEAGRVTTIVGVVQDVSEVREAQLALEQQHLRLERQVAERTAELRQQTSYLHALIDNFPFRVWLKDTGSRYLAVNRANADAAGLRIDQMLGRTDDEFMPAEVAARRQAEDRAAMAQRVPQTAELKTDTEAGGVWYETYKAPVFDADGAVIGTVGYLRDITERKTLEAAREAALAEAQRLAQVRSDFLANMSHEIRTPLSAMLGFAQLGVREDAGRRTSETFARILDSGQLLLGVINDILDFSKIEAGKLSVESLPYDPADAIDRAVDFVAAQADAKGLEFSVEESPALPAACSGDKLRVSQVLVNLLSNAVKFTDRGSVRLVAGVDDRWLRFDVIDTGIGMQADQVARLFRPFEQADTSTSRRFGGTGLGLAISSRLVELMGGMLGVESRPGAGSRFTLRLPLRDAAAPAPHEALAIVLGGIEPRIAAAAVAALAERGVVASPVDGAAVFEQPADLVVLACGAIDDKLAALAEAAMAADRRVAIVCHHEENCAGRALLRDRAIEIGYPLRARHLIAAARARAAGVRKVEAAGPRLRGVRVLAAEDNAINRAVLEEILALEGAQLTLAEDGEQALAELERHGAQAYDVVLTDIQMPRMDGYETARRMRVLAPSLPVIGLTAHAMREERERCRAVGMVEHVAKPIDIDVLVEAIRRHAAERGGNAGAVSTHVQPSAYAIDWAALAQRFPGRGDFIDRLAQTLLRTQSATPLRLREAAAHDDRAAIVFLAHTVKGMAGNLMAQRLQDLAHETENAAREDSPRANELAIRLADAMREVVEGVHTRLARDDGRPVSGANGQ